MEIDNNRLSIFVSGNESFSILYAKNSTNEFQTLIENTFKKNNFSGMTLKCAMLSLAELCKSLVRCDDENRSYIFTYVGV